MKCFISLNSQEQFTHIHFTDEETGVQIGWVLCPSSHSSEESESGFEGNSPGLKNCNPHHHTLHGTLPFRNSLPDLPAFQRSPCPFTQPYFPLVHHLQHHYASTHTALPKTLRLSLSNDFMGLVNNCWWTNKNISSLIIRQPSEDGWTIIIKLRRLKTLRFQDKSNALHQVTRKSQTSGNGPELPDSQDRYLLPHTSTLPVFPSSDLH